MKAKWIVFNCLIRFSSSLFFSLHFQSTISCLWRGLHDHLKASESIFIWDKLQFIFNSKNYHSKAASREFKVDRFWSFSWISSFLTVFIDLCNEMNSRTYCNWVRTCHRSCNCCTSDNTMSFQSYRRRAAAV